MKTLHFSLLLVILITSSIHGQELELKLKKFDDTAGQDVKAIDLSRTIASDSTIAALVEAQYESFQKLLFSNLDETTNFDSIRIEYTNQRDEVINPFLFFLGNLYKEGYETIALQWFEKIYQADSRLLGLIFFIAAHTTADEQEVKNQKDYAPRRLEFLQNFMEQLSNDIPQALDKRFPDDPKFVEIKNKFNLQKQWDKLKSQLH